MKSTLTALSKILIVFCVLCAVYCGVMVAFYMNFSEESYNLEIAQAKEQQAQGEATTAAVAAAKAENEELTDQLTAAQAVNAEKIAIRDGLQADVDGMNNLYDTILQTRVEYGTKVRQLEEMVIAGETDIRICYMTFDDGPNNLTQKMVEKLESHDVYATFFTIGANTADGQAANLRREMMGGHTVGNHTFSHAFNFGLYKKLENFTVQVTKQDEKVFEATGFHTELFRFPSGSVYCPFKEEAIEWLTENGYYWADWNASAWDSGFHSFDIGGENIRDNILHTIGDQKIAVVLCHDFNYSTYEGLDLVIPVLKERGYVFLPMFPQSITLEEPLNII